MNKVSVYFESENIRTNGSVVYIFKGKCNGEEGKVAKVVIEVDGGIFKDSDWNVVCNTMKNNFMFRDSGAKNYRELKEVEGNYEFA